MARRQRWRGGSGGEKYPAMRRRCGGEEEEAAALLAGRGADFLPVLDLRIHFVGILSSLLAPSEMNAEGGWDRIRAQVTFFNEVPCPPARIACASRSAGGLSLHDRGG